MKHDTDTAAFPRITLRKQHGQPVQWYERVGITRIVDWDGSPASYAKYLPVTAQRAYVVAGMVDRARKQQQ